MGKQQRKIARRSQRPLTTLAGPKMSPETERSIIFPPRVLRILSDSGHLIDEVTDFELGRAKYAAIIGRKG